MAWKDKFVDEIIRKPAAQKKKEVGPGMNPYLFKSSFGADISPTLEYKAPEVGFGMSMGKPPTMEEESVESPFIKGNQPVAGGAKRSFMDKALMYLGYQPEDMTDEERTEMDERTRKMSNAEAARVAEKKSKDARIASILSTMGSTPQFRVNIQ